MRFLRKCLFFFFFFFLVHRGSHIPSLWMRHTGCVFVARIHPSRTQLLGSFEPVQWNACVYRLDLGLYSHPKQIQGMESEPMLTLKEKSPLCGKLRGGLNLQCYIMQEGEPNTLPTSVLAAINLIYTAGWCVSGVPCHHGASGGGPAAANRAHCAPAEIAGSQE